MGIGLAQTTLKRALIIHAVAASIIFALVSAICFAYFGYTGALATAAGFVAIVIVMDVVVVALLILRELTMSRSVLGTWLPFALIFVSTYSGSRSSTHVSFTLLEPASVLGSVAAPSRASHRKA